MDNVLISPHVASATTRMRPKLDAEWVEKLL